MQAITVIIRMTGLLLFSPAPDSSTGSTYVLMPSETNHVAQIGYHKLDSIGCAYWEDNVCYLNLRDAEIELGTRGRATPVTLPPGNISTATTRRIAAAVFGDQPGARLAARLKLNEGRIDSTCSIARFAFGSDTLDLFSVVEWRFRIENGGPLVLATRTLNRRTPGIDTLVTLQATSGVVELFVRNIPRVERSHRTLNTAGTPGEELAHFETFYSLFEGPGYGPRPTLVEVKKPEGCPWIQVTRAAPRHVHPMHAPMGGPTVVTVNAGTLSCMVGSGSPGGGGNPVP